MKKIFVFALFTIFVFCIFAFFSGVGSAIFSAITFFPFFKKGLMESHFTESLANLYSVIFTTSMIYGGYNLFTFNKQKRMKGIFLIAISFALYFLLTCLLK